MRKVLALLFFLSFYLGVTAANGDGSGGVFSVVRKVGAFLDTMAVQGVDRNYIEAPKRPWQVILKGNINQSDLKMESTLHNSENYFFFMKGDSRWEPRIKTDPSTYLGVWAGYRGYGLGYSWNVGGDKGRILTFGATGGSYGVNLRIHWFENDEPELTMSGKMLDFDDESLTSFVPFHYSDSEPIESSIKTRALFLDGYYLFNGEHCSYAAAYDQSVIQKRSAGSLMAGAMYFHSTTHYDDPSNADIIFFMNDVGRFKSWQVSAGVGYIYNWVPVKGLLVSAMAIPMVTFYNHLKAWRYYSNVRDLLADPENGGMAILDLMDDENYKPELREADDDPVITRNSNLTVNIDARLSLTYQWDRYFINAFGQFTNFRYRMDDLKGRLNDWYINASLGVRF